MTDDVLLHGLRIRSEVPLHQGRPAPATGNAANATDDVDLEIVAGPARSATQERPPGQLLAEHELSPTEWYRFVRAEDGSFLLRYASVCDFIVDPALRHVTVRSVEGADPDMVSVFAGGALPAFILVMRGEPVLHASVVDVGGHAVGFVGQSGMGKSTLAGLLCAAGGRLVTDDVLRVSTGAGGPDHPDDRSQPVRCYLGGGELRMRTAARDLADRFASPPEARRTGDGRDALALPLSSAELLPLGAVVVPLPDRTAHQLTVSRLDPVDAVLALISLPRFVGWEDTVTQAQQFQLLGEVTDRVPVFTAHIPWGPPFADRLVGDLLDAVGVAHSLKAT